MVAAAIFAITVYFILTFIVIFALYGILKKDSNRYDHEHVWVKEPNHNGQH